VTILVTADLHLNNLPRDKYRHDFQKELRALIKKHGVHTCLLLGDLADEKDFHPAQLVNQMVDHIYRLAQLVPVIITKGNHDYTSLANTPFFAFLRRVEGVYWLGEPTLGKELENLPPASSTALAKALFLPHSPDPARDWASVPLKGHDWIFAHNTFAGAISDSGAVMSGTPTSIFPKDAKVISGDIHTPQVVGPVTYVGSPYRVDFGDDFDPRVLLIKGDKLNSVLCDGPRKQLIEVHAHELIKLHTKKVMDNLAEGDILKVRIELDTGDYAHWGEMKEKIREWAIKHKFVLHLVQPSTQRKGMAKKAVVRQSPKSDAQLLTSYGKQKGLDDATLEVGLEIINVS
jgi:DNA repair exonuclease SbcCD nuclease subunit